MHTDYLYLAQDRIADLHRDAERQRLARGARHRTAHVAASTAVRAPNLRRPLPAPAGVPPRAGD